MCFFMIAGLVWLLGMHAWFVPAERSVLQSNAPVLVHALKPRVAIMNNGVVEQVALDERQKCVESRSRAGRKVVLGTERVEAGDCGGRHGAGRYGCST